jgi:hypothetical protein
MLGRFGLFVALATAALVVVASAIAAALAIGSA